MGTTATERSRKWRAANVEHNRAYQREYQKRYRKEKPEKYERALASFRERYAANAEQHRARALEWARRNPEKACDLARRYRARKANAVGGFTHEQFAELCQALAGRCFYCGTSEQLHADHDVPLVRGGANDITNIIPACKSCNSSKGSLTAAEFIERRRRRDGDTCNAGHSA